MARIPSGSDWDFSGNRDSILKHKDRMIWNAIFQMLNRTTKIFKYSGLPDTIAKKDLELQLQCGGFAIWKKVDGKLYTFYGGLGGKPNPYYLPTIAIVANPALRYNESLKIDENCVVMLNDDFYQGLMPIFDKYASLLIEAEISLRFALINVRVPTLIEADNTRSIETAKEFFRKIEEGEEYGIIETTPELFDGIKTYDFYKAAYVKEIIEAIQYIKGSWYNEVGLEAAFNMKREAINEAEAKLNEQILYPIIDTMLEQRKIGLEKVNKMFGTNITVELDSIWADSRKTDEIAIEQSEAELELTESEVESNEKNDDIGNADNITET